MYYYGQGQQQKAIFKLAKNGPPKKKKKSVCMNDTFRVFYLYSSFPQETDIFTPLSPKPADSL